MIDSCNKMPHKYLKLIYYYVTDIKGWNLVKFLEWGSKLVFTIFDFLGCRGLGQQFWLVRSNWSACQDLARSWKQIFSLPTQFEVELGWGCDYQLNLTITSLGFCWLSKSMLCFKILQPLYNLKDYFFDKYLLCFKKVTYTNYDCLCVYAYGWLVLLQT